MSWWNKHLTLTGLVLFPGDMPPKEGDFAFLEKLGISMRRPTRSSREQWSIHLSHPAWGEAELQWDQSWPLPPRLIHELSKAEDFERQSAIEAKSLVSLRMQSKNNHVLRDRKLLLRFLRAIMADDGVAALDTLAQKVWYRYALDEELSHDADLDIDGITILHAVTEVGPAYWVHSHGLSEVGAFDFTIVHPSEEVQRNGSLLQAIAYSILEGSLSQTTPSRQLVSPDGSVRAVPTEAFLTSCDPRHRTEYAEMIDEHHRRHHAVLCQPQEGMRLLGLVGRPHVQPSRWMMRSLPENCVIQISRSATELMAERAVATYSLLRRLREEFAEFDLPCVVKLGIPTDSGRGDREHIWFEVHGLGADSIDATCLNQPYNVANLREGVRGTYAPDMLSDWSIYTPYGGIDPRSTTPARIMRNHPEEVRRIIRENNP